MLKSKKSKGIVSLLLAIVVLNIGCLNALAEGTTDTRSRGYQLIDGDVYDLNGNLLFKMYDGFTADGYTLDPNFTVHYPRKSTKKIEVEEPEEEPVEEQPIDTRSRGYQLIDGDVYDLNGNLLFKMYDGFTADGYTLDPDFTVHYPSNTVSVDNDEDIPDDIYSGNIYLPKNIDGYQGTDVGSSFKLTSSNPNVSLYYVSGSPSGVNFAVHNLSKGSVVDWIPGVPKKDLESVSVYNSSRPNDVYLVRASAVDVSGYARLKVGTQ